jgi:hypothetical protein
LICSTRLNHERGADVGVDDDRLTRAAAPRGVEVGEELLVLLVGLEPMVRSYRVFH